MVRALPLKSFNFGISKKAVVTGLVMAGIVVAAQVVQAGNDATFNVALTMITDWLEGSLGKLIAIAGLAIGLVGGIARGNLMAAATGVGMAIVGSAGPAILTGVFAAVLP